jgi:sulfite reductase (ferredoxin)
MQSFRTELENPIVEKDIIQLEKSIKLFRDGTLDSEKFRSLRLARGVYGQRQQGVQMIRIKLPYGKMSVKQMLKISDVSDEYAIKNLHLTTRQDIQIHYVSLERTPELWAELEKDSITLREACGNTVEMLQHLTMQGLILMKHLMYVHTHTLRLNIFCVTLFVRIWDVKLKLHSPPAKRILHLRLCTTLVLFQK